MKISARIQAEDRSVCISTALRSFCNPSWKRAMEEFTKAFFTLSSMSTNVESLSVLWKASPSIRLFSAIDVTSRLQSDPGVGFTVIIPMMWALVRKGDTEHATQFLDSAVKKTRTVPVRVGESAHAFSKNKKGREMGIGSCSCPR